MNRTITTSVLALLALVLSLPLAGCSPSKTSEVKESLPPIAAPAPKGPNAQFTLMAQDDGKLGSVKVENASGAKILAARNETTSVEGTGKAPGEPRILSDEEVRKLYGGALDALPPPPAHFILYFEKEKPDLTEASKPLIPKIAGEIQARVGADVSIVGHTDATGDRLKNYKLGMQRAETMAKLLAGYGLDLTGAEITSHGQDNPLVPAAEGVEEPRNRRVEITVR